MRKIGPSGVLVLAAAVAALALACAGPAPAAMLCKANEETCAPENRFPVPTTVEAALSEGTEAILKGSAIEVKCEESTLAGESTEENEEGEDPLIGKISSMAFGSCSGCTSVEAVHLPYKASLLTNDATELKGDGVMAVTSSGSGNPAVKVSGCPFGVTCTYGTSELKVSVEGGKPATVTISGASANYESGSGEFACGKTATMTQKQRLIVPLEVWVDRNSVLCVAKERPCVGVGNQYLANTLLEAKLVTGAKAVWETSLGTKITCAQSTLNGKTTKAVGVPGVLTPTFTQCENNCEVKVENTPYAVNLSVTSLSALGDGVLEITNLKIKLRCTELGLECQYGDVTTKVNVTGGNPAKFTMSNLVRKEGGEAAVCGEGKALWTGQYEFFKQNPMFLI